jgi:hypothetical protein
LLQVQVLDSVRPVVTSTTLPAQGTTSTGVVDRFNVSFSEDPLASAANNPANFDLRAAGPDGTFGTGDDVVYHITPLTAYTTGLTATYRVTDGPLQPGQYQFTIGTGLTDQAGNPLAAPYVQTFTLAALAPYTIENRSNDTTATATPLTTPTNTFSGSFTALPTILTTGTSPYYVLTAELNGDGKADLVVANNSSSTVSVFLGNGDGSFQTKTDYTVGANPTGLALADLNGDGKLDLVVADNGVSTVSVLLGNGNGTFQTKTDFTVGSRPFRVTAADLNGDGKIDLVVADSGASTVSVLLGNGNGTFQTKVDYATGSTAYDVAVGDVNGDGKPDLVVANGGSNSVSVLLGNGNGTFQTKTDYAGTGSNPYSIVLADLNGDGKLDIATANGGDYTNGLSVLLNSGNGTFGTPTNLNLSGGGTYSYQVIARDLNGDGKVDLVLADNTNRLTVAYGNGDGTFLATTYNLGSQELSAAIADFNGDGRPDIAVVNYGSTAGVNGVTIFTGDPSIALTADPAGSGLRSGYARGNLSSTSDTDYFSFTANAGDTLTLAAEIPGTPSGSTLSYYVYDAAGNQVTSFSTSYYGYGQSSPITLAGGNYRVRVTSYYDYEAEYRIRVTLAAPGTQMETEGNDALTSANTLSFAQASGSKLVATVAGAITTGDGSDYYYLGNLPAGVAINLSTLLPGTSILSPKVEVLLGPSGTVLADGDGNANDSGAVVVTTVAGPYYAHVVNRTSSVGLLAQYILSVKMTNTAAPVITGDTLPAAGTTSTGVIDRFSLTFGEDLVASTVNAPTSYDLRSAGPDGLFGTADDAVYHLTPQTAYVNGFTASFKITDGPLQPGNYRFTATTAIQNRFGTPLASALVQAFTVAPLAGYAIESRSDDTPATATSLGGTSATFAGSFTPQPTFAAGSNPFAVVSADLNGGGHLDLITANNGSGNITVYLGSGGGSFTPMTPISTGSGAVAIAVADFNGDGKLDLAVSNNSTNTVSILLGKGDGTFNAPTSIVVGNNPYHLIATDLNGDGKADLAVAVGGTNMVAVLINKADGTGTFKPVVNYATGSGTNPTDVAFADVDGDGKKDLIVPCYNTSNLVILKGNGDGTFQAAGTPIATGTSPRSIVAADFNGDGKIDLVTANDNNADVSVLLGNGNGTFAPAVTASINGNAYQISVMDFNGDGKLDLVMATSTSRVNVGYGQGNGTFNWVSYNVGSQARSTAFGDFNEDGRPDLAVADYGNSTVFLMTGDAALPLPEDPVGSGIRSAAIRGNMSSTSDTDYYSFSANVGDVVTIGEERPNSINYSRLNYYLLDAGGNTVASYTSAYNVSTGQLTATIPNSGIYRVRVTTYDDYEAEYRLRVTLTNSTVTSEVEPNDTVATATPVTLVPSGSSMIATVTGYAATNNDLDYFNLGTISAGQSIFLTTSKPSYSGIDPTVSIYNASNAYIPEAGSGRPFDGVAQVDITTTGVYYAVIHANNLTGALLSQYLMNIQVVATGSLVFPNLQVTAVTAPSGTLQSGQTTTLTFTVTNVGNQPTQVGNWYDQAVLSTDKIFGNADDIPLASFAHTGVLNPGQSYTITPNVNLPDGISGDYYLILNTDSTSVVNEGPLEGDNATTSAATFHINLAPYADLQVQNLAVSGPDASDVFHATWSTANAGNGAVSGSWHEKIVVTTAVGGTIVFSSEPKVTGPLAAGATLARSIDIPNLAPGLYNISVTTDSQNEVYEFDANGHADAEGNNVATLANLANTLDLQVGPITFQPGTGLQSGSALAINWTDVNAGNRPTTGAWTDHVTVVNTATGQTLLSRDVAYDPTANGNGAIAGGDSRARTTSFILPDGSPGVGSLLVTITVDSNNTIPEFNTGGTAESNNVATASIASTIAAYPDLQVSQVTFSPSSGLQSGNALTVNWTDANTGNKATATSWYDSVVITRTNASGTQTLYSGTVYYDPTAQGNGNVAAGDSRSHSLPITLPDGVSGTGTITATVTIDYYNNLFEYNPSGTGETNNTTTSTTTSTLAPYADLLVTPGSLSVTPASPTSGGTLTVSWTDTNQGTGAVGASSSDYVLVQRVNADNSLTSIASATSRSPSPPITTRRSRNTTARATPPMPTTRRP